MITDDYGFITMLFYATDMIVISSHQSLVLRNITDDNK